MEAQRSLGAALVPASVTASTCPSLSLLYDAPFLLPSLLSPPLFSCPLPSFSPLPSSPADDDGDNVLGCSDTRVSYLRTQVYTSQLHIIVYPYDDWRLGGPFAFNWK